MKRTVTNGNRACCVTPLRRSTLNLTLFNHDDFKRRVFTSTPIVLLFGTSPPFGDFFWTTLTMSAVLLSSGDGLTISGQNSPQVKRTGTCRNLFGPVDHDELRRELTSKLKEIGDRDRLRWNFDFGDEQPLDGELEWEASPAGDCPAFYRERTATDVSKEPKNEIFALKCEGRSTPVNIVTLQKKNKTHKRNVNLRKTVPLRHSRTKRLTDLRITGT